MRLGQLVTILAICASGSQSISALAARPATCSSACAISRTVVVSAGRLTAVRTRHSAALALAARVMPATVLPGEASATRGAGAGRTEDAGDGVAGRGERDRRLGGHRAARALAGQRLAQHAAEETRGRAV